MSAKDATEDSGDVAEMGVVWTFKPVRAILGSDVDPRKEAGLSHPEQGC